MPKLLPFDAGWSSPVARQAHNLKVVGSNPTPATKYIKYIKGLDVAATQRPAPGIDGAIRGGGGNACCAYAHSAHALNKMQKAHLPHSLVYQHITDDHCLIVFLVARGVDERHQTAPR